MTINFENFFWINQPKVYKIASTEIRIQTEPDTDLWQRTYYGFRHDNAPAFLMTSNERYFSFTFKTNTAPFQKRFDQTGVIVYQDSDNWFKAGIETENETFQRLGSVVTNDGFSDWASTDISTEVTEMYYRLSRRESDFCIEYSKDGQTYQQMRIFHLAKGAGEIQFGIYAASPEDSSFEAVFSEFTLGECQWLTHQ